MVAKQPNRVERRPWVLKCFAAIARALAGTKIKVQTFDFIGGPNRGHRFDSKNHPLVPIADPVW
jgi:hypothetical protein